MRDHGSFRFVIDPTSKNVRNSYKAGWSIRQQKSDILRLILGCAAKNCIISQIWINGGADVRNVRIARWLIELPCYTPADSFLSDERAGKVFCFQVQASGNSSDVLGVRRIARPT